MITFYPYSTSPKMGSSSIQRQPVPQSQNSLQRVPQPTSQFSKTTQPSIQSNLYENLKKLQELGNTQNPVQILQTSARIESNTAATLKKFPESQEAQMMASLMNQQAMQQRQIAKTIVDAPWKTNGQQMLKDELTVQLKLMMLDLGHPNPTIADSAARHLRAMGLPDTQIREMTQKLKEEKKTFM